MRLRKTLKNILPRTHIFPSFSFDHTGNSMPRTFTCPPSSLHDRDILRSTIFFKQSYQGLLMSNTSSRRTTKPSIRANRPCAFLVRRVDLTGKIALCQEKSTPTVPSMLRTNVMSTSMSYTTMDVSQSWTCRRPSFQLKVIRTFSFLSP